MSDFEFIPGESFNGVVARWADQVGGVERMIDLTSVAGVRYGHRQQAATATEEEIRALADEMKVDAGELLSRATPYLEGDWTNHRHPIRFGHVVVPSTMIEKRVRRFSPAGLATSAHHRAVWDVRLLPVCTVTGEVLLGRCGDPDCGSTGWAGTLGIDLCEHCLTDLSRLQPPKVTEETREALGELAGLFSHDRAHLEKTLAKLPPAVAHLDASEVIDLVLRIVPVVDAGLPIDVRDLFRSEPIRLSDAVAGAWRVVRNWPDGMAALAADRIATRTGRHNDGNGGRTTRFLSRKRQAAASPAVSELIAAWRRSISVDTPDGADMRERTVTSTELTALTRIGSPRMMTFRREGMFRTHFVLDIERPEARFDREEIEELGRVLDDRASAWAAHNELGISNHGIEQLAAMGLIEPIYHAYLDARFGTGQISRASLDALITAVKSLAGPTVADGVQLRAAMNTVGGRLKPWGEVFRMLVAGELGFSVRSGKSRLAESIVISAADVPLLRSLSVSERMRAALSAAMSKEDAGETLNLSPPRFVKLLAHFASVPGRSNKHVPVEQVERLARRHIAVAEIAARCGVSPIRAHYHAIAAGVPYLGTGGFCRRTAEAKLFADDRP